VKKIGYLVFGGYVRSRYDGQYHYVSAARVAQLYGLNPRDPDVRLACLDDPSTWKGFKKEEWICLYPLNSGKYYNVRERRERR